MKSHRLIFSSLLLIAMAVVSIVLGGIRSSTVDTELSPCSVSIMALSEIDGVYVNTDYVEVEITTKAELQELVSDLLEYEAKYVVMISPGMVLNTVHSRRSEYNEVNYLLPRLVSRNYTVLAIGDARSVDTIGLTMRYLA